MVYHTACNVVVGLEEAAATTAAAAKTEKSMQKGGAPTAPVITIFADPTTLRPLKGKTVSVTVFVSGTITGNEAGGTSVDPSTAAYAVTDTYKRIQPSGKITLASDGSYFFSINWLRVLAIALSS
jgi:hypothetical protein